MSNVSVLVDQLSAKDNRLAYASLKQLLAESEAGSEVYGHWEAFVSRMDRENSFCRTRGLRLMAANARWDEERKLDTILPAFLSHIRDESPITARQLIQALPEVGGPGPTLFRRSDRRWPAPI